MTVLSRTKAGLLAGVACTALIAAATGANAGGFALREQSAEFQGMSFAGSAAGGSLSSMFWNSAATASREGMNFESSYSAILARSEVTVDRVTVAPNGGPGFAALGVPNATVTALYGLTPNTADGIAPAALVAASYGNYQVTKDLYIGMGVNAPFGLTLEPNRANYQAGTLAETAKMVAFNFNPTIAYKVMPGVTVGVGAQLQTAEATFRFLGGNPFNGSMVSLEANGWGFGATAGVLVEPMAGTTIGVGWRSRINQQFEGLFHSEATGGNGINSKVELKLPDIVTVSLKQVVTPQLRAAATFEWTQWSRFQSLTVTAAESGRGPLNVGGPVAAGTIVANLPYQWEDSWMVSFGLEYDVSPTLTARAGYGYERTPIQSEAMRSPGFPDNNRNWMSFGGTWKALPNTTFDLAWSHIFVEEGKFNRDTLAPDLVPTATTNIQGHVNTSIDIISVGMKTKF